MENGLVLNYDVRNLPSNLETPLPARFTLSAHDGATSALDINPHIRGCIATGGADKLVKIWNVDDSSGKMNVTLVTSRDLGVVSFSFRFMVKRILDLSMQGKVFSTTFSPDDPLTVAAGGSKAKLQVWDIGANFGARKAFGTKLKEAGKVLKEREDGGNGGVIGVDSDEEEEENDD